MIFRDLHQDMTDFFALLNFTLKLGFREEARSMSAVLPPGTEAARYAARLLLASGQAEEAIAMLAPAKLEPDGAIDLIKAYIQTENYHEAERLAAIPDLADNIQALDLRVGLASYLQLPTETYLDRMRHLLFHQTKALFERISRGSEAWA